MLRYNLTPHCVLVKLESQFSSHDLQKCIPGVTGQVSLLEQEPFQAIKVQPRDLERFVLLNDWFSV